MKHKVTDTIITGQASSCSSVSLLFHMPAWKTISPVLHCNNLFHTYTKLGFTGNDTYSLIKHFMQIQGQEAQPNSSQSKPTCSRSIQSIIFLYSLLINIIFTDVNDFTIPCIQTLRRPKTKPLNKHTLCKTNHTCSIHMDNLLGNHVCTWAGRKEIRRA